MRQHETPSDPVAELFASIVGDRVGDLRTAILDHRGTVKWDGAEVDPAEAVRRLAIEPRRTLIARPEPGVIDVVLLPDEPD